jgi:hypothetical protein
MKSFYSIYCLLIVAFFGYVSFTGRTLWSPGGKRNWSRPGKRSLYYHK